MITGPTLVFAFQDINVITNILLTANDYVFVTFQQYKFCQIWGVHDGKNTNFGILGFDKMSSCR